MVFILLAPLFGLVMGFLFMTATYWLCRNTAPYKVSGLFRKLQLVSGGGVQPRARGNDAQKTMGITSRCSSRRGAWPRSTVPLWVVSLPRRDGPRHARGGWRIVKTMGKLAELQPVHGFSAESAGALCLYGAT